MKIKLYTLSKVKIISKDKLNSDSSGLKGKIEFNDYQPDLMLT